ncbi:MAG TPA: preQ(1) synthase [Chloroflexota bacterium]|nr:preQ(1) synthase [Chloroflexota bacterium]
MDNRAPTVPEKASTSDRTDLLRPGERAIAEAQFEILPNPATARDYLIHFTFPEFTCKCPRTGYPDFATMDLWVAPDESIVELKSLKLYLNRFRDVYIFHEAATNQVLDDLVEALHPKWARIVARWNPRGNLGTVISSEHQPEQRPDILLDDIDD